MFIIIMESSIRNHFILVYDFGVLTKAALENAQLGNIDTCSLPGLRRGSDKHTCGQIHRNRSSQCNMT